MPVNSYVCTGSVESFSYAVTEEWYDLESFYDPLNAVMQLARQVNLLQVALTRDPYPFHRVGTSTVDHALASVDYESNPTWNPLYDIKVILTQCISLIYSSIEHLPDFYYHPSLNNCSTDSLVRYIGNTDITTDFISNLTDLNSDRKDHWYQYIYAARTALEAIELEVEAVVTPYYIYNDTDPYGTIRVAAEVISSEADVFAGQNDTDAIFRTTWLPTEMTEIRFGNGSSWANYNLWPNRNTQCSDALEIVSGSAIEIGSYFVEGYPINTSPDGAYNSFYIEDPFCDNRTTVTFPSGAKPGWTTKSEVRFTVRFEKIPYTELTITDDILNQLTGETIEWELVEIQYKDIATEPLASAMSYVEYTVSPGMSGSFVWAEDEHVKDIEFTITLTDPHNYGVNDNGVSFEVNSIYTYALGVDCDGQIHVCTGG